MFGLGTCKHSWPRSEEARGVELVDLLSGLQDHGGLQRGEDEVGVLQLAPPAVHCPHVHRARDLERGQHLGFEGLIEEEGRGSQKIDILK